jgi:hypothetical protein
MLREIFEQADAVLHTVLAMHSADAGYSGFDFMGRVAAALLGVKEIVIAAIFERLVRMPGHLYLCMHATTP